MKKYSTIILILCIGVLFAQEQKSEIKITDKKTGKEVVFCKYDMPVCSKHKNNSPLYVLIYKGESLLLEDNNYIKDIKPEGIESITVLKDQSIVDEKYGKNIVNGVIEIYLKENRNNSKLFYDLQTKTQNNGKD